MAAKTNVKKSSAKATKAVVEARNNNNNNNKMDKVNKTSSFGFDKITEDVATMGIENLLSNNTVPTSSTSASGNNNNNNNNGVVSTGSHALRMSIADLYRLGSSLSVGTDTFRYLTPSIMTTDIINNNKSRDQHVRKNNNNNNNIVDSITTDQIWGQLSLLGAPLLHDIGKNITQLVGSTVGNSNKKQKKGHTISFDDDDDDDELNDLDYDELAAMAEEDEEEEDIELSDDDEDQSTDDSEDNNDDDSSGDDDLNDSDPHLARLIASRTNQKNNKNNNKKSIEERRNEALLAFAGDDDEDNDEDEWAKEFETKKDNYNEDDDDNDGGDAADRKPTLSKRAIRLQKKFGNNNNNNNEGDDGEEDDDDENDSLGGDFDGLYGDEEDEEDGDVMGELYGDDFGDDDADPNSKNNKFFGEDEEDEDDGSDEEGDEDDNELYDADEDARFQRGMFPTDNDDGFDNILDDRYEAFHSNDKLLKKVGDGEAEEDDDDDVDEDTLTDFQLRQRQEKKFIKTLEQKRAFNADWSMGGEVEGRARPKDSLIDEALDFEHGMKSVPVITEALTAKLEERIKKRIFDNNFNDVVRRQSATTAADISSANDVVKRDTTTDAEKSKASLVDLYEKDYLAKLRKMEDAAGMNENIAEPLTEIEKDELKAIQMWKRLSQHLDALSNYYFTPKPVQEDINVRIRSVEKAAPAISMETVGNFVISKASAVAPQDTFRPSQKQMLGNVSLEEMTPRERQALRRAKKDASTVTKARIEKKVADKKRRVETERK